MDLGINIPAGAHFTQIAAYDFDLDGKAELAFKTAPGTKDGKGHYVSEASLDADIRAADNTEDLRHTEGGVDDSFGRALSGDEYYTVFEGDSTIPIPAVRSPSGEMTGATAPNAIWPPLHIWTENIPP